MDLNDEISDVCDKLLFPQFFFAFWTIVIVFHENTIIGVTEEKAAIWATVVVGKTVCDIFTSFLIPSYILPCF